MTLFGNRVFGKLIKLRCGHTGIRVSPKANDWCPYTEREIWRYRDIYNGKRAMWGWRQKWEWYNYKPVNAKESQPPQGARREAGRGVSEPLEGANPADRTVLNFFPRSREMMPYYISVRGKCSPQHSSFLDLQGLTSACPVLFVCMEKMHLR